MSVIEKEVELYLLQVKEHLVCPEKKKKAIMRDVREAVLDYAEESGTTDIEEIYKRFGKPEDIAKAHLADADPKEIKKALNVKRGVVGVVAVAVAIVVIAFISMFVAMFVDVHKETQGYFVETLSTSPAWSSTSNQ